MANKKISQYTELTAGQVAADDYIEVVDTSAGDNKKVKASALLAGTQGIAPPTTTILSTQRAGGGTIANISNGLGVRISYTPPASDTNVMVYALQAISSGATGWNAIAKIRLNGFAKPYFTGGLVVRDSVSGKSEIYGMAEDTNWKRATFSSDTALNSGATFGGPPQQEVWMKVEQTSTARKWYFSFNAGDTWVLHANVASGSWYVTSATHVGFGMNPNYGGFGTGQSVPIDLDCLAWQQNAI